MNQYLRSYLGCVIVCLLAIGLSGAAARARTIEFETREVTEADVTVSPDGQWLIFTLLGHLFRLPVEGGTAEQLTLGPYYDTDPIFSPDGFRVAFVSDRDGSEGNIFVLELATGQITQVTHEPWAARPTWSLNGEAILYLSFDRSARPFVTSGNPPLYVPALVWRASLRGGEPDKITATPALYRSIFLLPDGKVGWTVAERDAVSFRWTTRIEARGADGEVSILRTTEGFVDRAIPNPTATGLYALRFIPLSRFPPARAIEELLFLPFGEERERHVAPVTAWWWSSRFSLAPAAETVYLGHAGRIWKVLPGSGFREPIPFVARVRIEIREPATPTQPRSPGSSFAPRAVLHPRISPDARSLVLGAAGYLWQQLLSGGPATRLIDTQGFVRDPAFSPDGSKLAFVYTRDWKSEVRVFDFQTRRTRTVASGPLFYSEPAWSPDGRRLVFVEVGTDWPFRILAADVESGTKEQVGETGWWSLSRPHFSADGSLIHYSGSRSDNRFYSLRIDKKAEAQPVTKLSVPMNAALISPDGRWLAFAQNTEIWLAPLGASPPEEKDLRQLSHEGGTSFSFTPDSKAIIYASGNRVWCQPLAGGQREEIPIRLDLRRKSPPPVLLRRVRLLDFKAGGFAQETSVLIEDGRIQEINVGSARKLPPATITVDTAGRFAMPGLFDLHQHEGYVVDSAYLAWGITSLRDVGGWLASLNALADRGEVSSDPVPRYFFSGEMFESSQPVRWCDDCLLLDAEEKAREYVRKWKELGAHFIKVHPPISWPLLRVVGEEARRQGLPVIGHGLAVEEIVKSVRAGYWGLEHFPWSSRPYDDVLQLLAAAGTRWVPTLGTTSGTELLLRDQPERLADPKARSFFPGTCRVGTEGMKSVPDRVLRGWWAEQLAGIRDAHRRGVRVLAGTDIFRGRCLPAVSLHWELEHFVAAGFTPLEVLRIATQQAAEAVGAQDDLGTLEPGKLADIVLLDNNPLEDIRNTQTIWRVIKGGWVFDPQTLRPPASATASESKQ